MTTIAQFSKPEEAHLLRMRLGAAGIEAFIRDEYMVQLDWLLSNAMGGVRVDVRDEEAKQAIEIMNAEPGEPPKDEGESPGEA